MKRLVIFCVLAMAACGGNSVRKPDNLISRDKMADILYDLQLLEAIRTQKPDVLARHNVDPNQYIFEKYHIDSLQLARSSQYYAHDLAGYKELCEEVSRRFGADIQPAPANAPMVQ